MQPITRNNDDRIDELESTMFEAAKNSDDVQLVDCPLIHTFTPKMYVRQILMPEGSLITSKIHKTEHPFVVVQGEIYVRIDNGEWEIIQAPYFGRTLKGTRRVLFANTDTIWATFHALDFITGGENDLPENEKMKVVERIEDIILEPYENKLLGGIVTRNQITNSKNQSSCLLSQPE